MKIHVHFVSADNKAVHIEISNEGCTSNQPYFSIVGDCGIGCGQIYDDFEPTKAQAKLVKIWRESHLKNGECLDLMEQCQQIVDEINKENEERFAAFENEYDINKDDEEMSCELCKVFYDSDDTMRVIALARFLGLCYDEALDIEACGNCLYEAQGTQYYVGYEYELEDIAKDHLDRYLWVDCVANGCTNLGFDDWVENVIYTDGFASVLNSYDGTYDEVKVFDETLVVCRA